MAAPRKTPKAPEPKKKCDNHPSKDATFSTTSNGAHQRITLCASCVPRHWKR